MTNESEKIIKQELDDEKRKYEEEAIKIIKQAVYEVNRKYELEAIYRAEKKGRKEGREEAKKDTKEEIAKKLKGIISPEETAKATGLNLYRVLELQEI